MSKRYCWASATSFRKKYANRRDRHADDRADHEQAEVALVLEELDGIGSLRGIPAAVLSFMRTRFAGATAG